VKNININKLLLIAAVLLFLIIFPYTRHIEKFRANDATWDLLNRSVSYKEFDPKIFSFRETFEISEELKKLNLQTIAIKGFIKKNVHGDHKNIALTENVSDVCFMCDHDNPTVYILITEKVKGSFDSIADDQLVRLKGIFLIDTYRRQSLFHLVNAEIYEDDSI
jgi:hypothetical protein